MAGNFGTWSGLRNWIFGIIDDDRGTSTLMHRVETQKSNTIYLIYIITTKLHYTITNPSLIPVVNFSSLEEPPFREFFQKPMKKFSALRRYHPPYSGLRPRTEKITQAKVHRALSSSLICHKEQTREVVARTKRRARNLTL